MLILGNGGTLWHCLITLILWLRRKTLRLLKEVVVLYASDKIRIYSNNNTHKKEKKQKSAESSCVSI